MKLLVNLAVMTSACAKRIDKRAASQVYNRMHTHVSIRTKHTIIIGGSVVCTGKYVCMCVYVCMYVWLQGMDITEQNIVVWSGRRVEVYNITEHGLQTLSAFELNTLSMALYRTSIYAVVDGALVCLNLSVRWRGILAQHQAA